jgi:hypothetical protein
MYAELIFVVDVDSITEAEDIADGIADRDNLMSTEVSFVTNTPTCLEAKQFFGDKQ